MANRKQTPHQESRAGYEQVIRSQRRKNRILKLSFIISEIVLLVIVIACAIILHLLDGVRVMKLPEDDIVTNTGEHTVTPETEVVTDEAGSTHVVEHPSVEDPSIETVESMDMPFAGKEFTTIVIYGLDGRSNVESLVDSSNSDVQILLVINNKTGEIKMMSIYRDTLMRLENKDSVEEEFDRANAPMCRYGVLSAVNTLNVNLDLKIDHYVCINWAAAVEIINELGGVDVAIEPHFWETVNDEGQKVVYLNGLISELVREVGVPSMAIPQENFNGELWHADGVQAVAYMRLRRTDSDLNRTARQREVIEKMMQKAKSADIVTLLRVWEIVKKNMALSLDQSDVLGLLYNIGKYRITETRGYPFTLYGGGDYKYIEGKDWMDWIIIPTNVVENVKKAHEFLYGQEDYKVTDEIWIISEQIRKMALFDENWEPMFETREF